MVTEGLILSNRYLVGKELGAGGMGAVYEAVNLRTGGPVAVKILHPLYARNPQYIARLRREAQIAASIRSTCAVKVIDLDEHQGMPYLVMEYVAGETLSERLERERRLPAYEALNVCIEIARTLDAAHAIGVVHRDLKPQNVKITDEGEVKVLDFGIARAENLPGITGTNMFTGTPEYCAPERITGTGDIRSDIYSLGIILYELIAGQRPFDAPTAFGVLRQHEIAPVPPLPVAVPPEVQEVLDRTLAKKPEHRHQTPEELLAALRWARDAALSADGPGRPIAATVVRPAVGPYTGGTRAQVDVPTGSPATSPGAPPVTAVGPRTLALIGGAALALVLVAVAAFAFTRDSTNGPPDGQTSPDEASAALLAPGEKLTLNIRNETPLTGGCLGPNREPRVKHVLVIRSIEVEQSHPHRVRVDFVTSVPAVPGVSAEQCRVTYSGDAGTEDILLETATASGAPVAAYTVDGAGAAVLKEPAPLYGKELEGTWIFDKVQLNGVDLTLVQRYKPPGESGFRDLHRIKLLPR